MLSSSVTQRQREVNGRKRSKTVRRAQGKKERKECWMDGWKEEEEEGKSAIPTYGQQEVLLSADCAFLLTISSSLSLSVSVLSSGFFYSSILLSFLVAVGEFCRVQSRRHAALSVVTTTTTSGRDGFSVEVKKGGGASRSRRTDEDD